MDSPAPCPSGIGCGSIEPAASSGASLPSHGLKIEGVTPVELEEENKTDLPTTPKWQIGLFLWQKVARRETERSAASAKRAATTHRGIPKGTALGAPLVTFPATGKSPGCRAERLHQGPHGLPAPHNPPGRGAERPLMGRSAEDGAPAPPRIVQQEPWGAAPSALPCEEGAPPLLTG